MKPHIKTNDMFSEYNDLRERAIVRANVPKIVYNECGLKLTIKRLPNRQQDQILEFESEKDKFTFILKYA